MDWSRVDVGIRFFRIRSILLSAFLAELLSESVSTVEGEPGGMKVFEASEFIVCAGNNSIITHRRKFTSVATSLVVHYPTTHHTLE